MGAFLEYTRLLWHDGINLSARRPSFGGRRQPLWRGPEPWSQAEQRHVPPHRVRESRFSHLLTVMDCDGLHVHGQISPLWSRPCRSDQDILLGSMDPAGPMQKTRKLVVEKGAWFANGFATTPICCPSRAEIT